MIVKISLMVFVLFAPVALGAGWPCAQQADVDGDGKSDHVVLCVDTAGVRVGQDVLEPPIPTVAVRSICLADLTGDGMAEVLADVVLATDKDKFLRHRIFIYKVERHILKPLFLGTQGGGILLGFGAADLDGDGHAEVMVREADEDEEQSLAYVWKGFSLKHDPRLDQKVPQWSPALNHQEHLAFVLSLNRNTEEKKKPKELNFERTPGKIRKAGVRLNLAPAVNRKKFRRLPKSARRHLARYGFVVLRKEDSPSEFHSLYLENVYKGLPSYVSSDAALHFAHLLFDQALKESEENLLVPALMRLLDDTYQVAKGIASAQTKADPALDRVLIRLEVARALMSDQTIDIPSAHLPVVKSLVDAIDKCSPAKQDPFGLDFNDFIVRGHYAADPMLSRYFRAYLFLSLSTAKDKKEAALLAACVLSRPMSVHLLELFDRHTRLLIGPLSGSSPLDILPDMKKVLGPSPSVFDLLSGDWVDRLKRIPGPILSRGWPRDNDLLLQGVDTERRQFPDPLDLLYALGSERAAFHLQGEFEKWQQLKGRLDKAKSAFVSSRGADLGSVAGRWLASLRWVLLPYPKGYAFFQRSTSWADHNLVTAAASWAELRRDTILYTEPPIMWAEGGDHEELPPSRAGYVEPVPELYEELADLMADFSKSLAYQDEQKGGKNSRKEPSWIYTEGEKLLRFLANCARKELAGKRLSRDEYERLSYIGEEFEEILAGSGRLHLDPVPVVADVYYFGNPETGSKKPLLVATGPVDEIIVAVPIGKRTILARGAVSSFWHFIGGRPMSDEEWRKLLSSHHAPAQPAWAKPLVIGRTHRKRR